MDRFLPAIVVAAHNRPASLKRLLRSLLDAHYTDVKIPIVISIDGGGANNGELQKIATEFEWPFGPKRLVFHKENLGLIGHVFACGNLTEVYGSIVFLEDDLVVGRQFYTYAQQALAAFSDDPKIGGISLSALWFHGFSQLPFEPYLDDGDNFFAQVAWFQGQVYTAEQWSAFKSWLDRSQWNVKYGDRMHPLFSFFPNTDWFPIKTKYLVRTGRYYAFPRASLAVNFGDTGTHFAKSTSFFQVPIEEQKTSWRFQSLEKCLAVYDSWQEMLPDRIKRLVPSLADVDFQTDFYGERDAARIKSEFVLTSQTVHASDQSWGLTMRPPVANLTHDVEGNQLVLARPQDIDQSLQAKLINEWQMVDYFGCKRPIGRRKRLRLWLGRRFARKRL